MIPSTEVSFTRNSLLSSDAFDRTVLYRSNNRPNNFLRCFNSWHAVTAVLMYLSHGEFNEHKFPTPQFSTKLNNTYVHKFFISSQKEAIVHSKESRWRVTMSKGSSHSHNYKYLKYDSLNMVRQLIPTRQTSERKRSFSFSEFTGKHQHQLIVRRRAQGRYNSLY